MVIFKGSRIKDKWREAAPSGYTLKATESGYVNAEVFSDYGKEFVLFLRERNLLRPDQKHLVLLDLHKSHLFNMKYMTWMKENNIEVCCFPPNCTHILQPLDDVPFAALKTRYQKELGFIQLQICWNTHDKITVLSGTSTSIHPSICT